MYARIFPNDPEQGKGFMTTPEVCGSSKYYNMNKQINEPRVAAKVPLGPGENIDGLLQNAWLLTLNSLWPHMEEARNAEEWVKKFIRSKFINGQDPYKKYIEYCERILLCWEVIASEYAFGQMEYPNEWFDPKNKNGFAVSGIFYKLLAKMRKKNPMANCELKALAEALVDISETGTKENFKYWRSWFFSHNAYDEYILFYMCTVKNSYILNNNKR